jgi:hypothetical protein
MATVSTIHLSVDLLDCAFVDSLDPRFLYRDSPYEIALTVLNGEAGPGRRRSMSWMWRRPMTTPW